MKKLIMLGFASLFFIALVACDELTSISGLPTNPFTTTSDVVTTTTTDIETTSVGQKTTTITTVPVTTTVPTTKVTTVPVTTAAPTTTVTTVPVTTTMPTTTVTTAPVTTIEEPIEEDPFVPGAGGVLAERAPSENAEGKFGGLMLAKVNCWRSIVGTDYFVEIDFPSPSQFDGTSYTLQYYDTVSSTWKDYVYYDRTVTFTDENNGYYGLTVSESRTLRLLLNDGPMAGYTSNEESYTLPTIKCRFDSYTVDMSVNEEGIMYPYVGFTTRASFEATNFEGETDIDVTNTLIYKWYRVDPVTYKQTLIASATGQTEYDATMDDAGYYIMVRAEGDQNSSSGFWQVLVGPVVVANPCFVRNESATGFTVNLYYEVSGLDPALFEIFDQDWNEVDILSIVKGENDATYIITIDDATITNFYSIAYNSGFWTMQFNMSMGGGEFHHFTEILFVEVVPTEGEGEQEDPFIPGVGGVLAERTPSENAEGKFGGLMITEVDCWPSFSEYPEYRVIINYLSPGLFGGTSYTLQYYDTASSTWKNYMYNDEVLTLTTETDDYYGLATLTVSEARTLRLLLNGGPMAGYTSNEESYILPMIKCRFDGYAIDMCINEEGIMYPYAGFTLRASFSAVNFAGETDVDVSDTLIYKWYRVDPVTYEQT
ncbi:MAG: hypothetical protein GX904_03545, partial [Acholeplasmataceae bacterium]|nr:hypothetical protein [Acholeplasmataceae bacterium]